MIQATEDDVHAGNIGGCLECRQLVRGGVEPDAREYLCVHCGAREVYGLDELLLQGQLELTAMSADEKKGALVETHPVDLAPPALDLNRLTELAVQQGEEGVKALERLVELKERIDAREAEKAFARALLRFQNECPTITKPMKGPGGAYNFAPLDYITRTISPHTDRNGLSWTWEDDPDPPAGNVRVYTILRHTGGHSTRTLGPSFPTASTNKMITPMQGVAIAQTYARRYGLMSALGIAPGGEDTDGGLDEFISEDQVATILALMEEVDVSTDRFNKMLGIDQIGHLLVRDYPRAVRSLEKKRSMQR